MQFSVKPTPRCRALRFCAVLEHIKFSGNMLWINHWHQGKEKDLYKINVLLRYMTEAKMAFGHIQLDKRTSS